MTKKEIVKKISEEKGLTQLAVKEIVQMTFDAIVETLIEDPKHRIELRNFGVFEVKKRAARTARNPRTGDRVEVPAKFVVTFKPGKEMEERVLELERAEAARDAAARQNPPADSTYPAQQQGIPTTPESPIPPQPGGHPASNGEFGNQPPTTPQPGSWNTPRDE